MTLISFLPIWRCRRSLASRFARPQRHGARRDEGPATVQRLFRAVRVELREQRRRAIEPQRTLRICRCVERRPRPPTFLG
jgi:hypothetical protein